MRTLGREKNCRKYGSSGNLMVNTAEAGGSQWAGQPPHSVSDLHWGVRATTTVCMHTNTNTYTNMITITYTNTIAYTNTNSGQPPHSVSVSPLSCVSQCMQLHCLWAQSGCHWWLMTELGLNLFSGCSGSASMWCGLVSFGSNMMWDNFAVFSFWVHFKRPGRWLINQKS